MLLTLVRHAKSSWSDPSLSDFDRPLNERGNRDAPKMARWFFENIQETPILFTSPANRALSTAKYFAKEFSPTKLNIVDDLYHANLQDYERTTILLWLFQSTKVGKLKRNQRNNLFGSKSYSSFG